RAQDDDVVAVGRRVRARGLHYGYLDYDEDDDAYGEQRRDDDFEHPPGKAVKHYERRDEREQRRKIGVPRRGEGEEPRGGEQQYDDDEPELMPHPEVPPIWYRARPARGQGAPFRPPTPLDADSPRRVPPPHAQFPSDGTRFF